MLGKLMKYEFKASSRLFLLLYAALLVLSIVNSILMHIRDGFEHSNTIIEILSSLFMFGYVILIIAVVIATIIAIITRFYKNLLGDEGYLMFTLPVGTDSHILSKLITSVIWCMLSMLVVTASLFILTATFSPFEVVSAFYKEVSALGVSVPLWILAFIVTIIVYMVHLITTFYASMALGSNLTKNRLLGSFLGYLIMYAIGQVIGLVSIGVIYAGGFFGHLIEFESTGMAEDQIISMMNSVGIGLFVYINALSLLMIAIYYFVTRYFIKNKLNLA